MDSRRAASSIVERAMQSDAGSVTTSRVDASPATRASNEYSISASSPISFPPHTTTELQHISARDSLSSSLSPRQQLASRPVNASAATSTALSSPASLPVSTAALRRFRGFSSIDRVFHCGHVYVLKRSPSSLSSSLWKLRTAVLSFGAVTLYRVSPSSSSSFSLCSAFSCASPASVQETESISLNYACLDVVGWDAAAGLFLLRLLSDAHLHAQHRGLQSPGRRWFVFGFTAKEECRSWIDSLSLAIAHPLVIYYNGDNLKVRLREPVEPPLPPTRSTLQLLPRGYRGAVELVPRYENEEGESERDELVERKVGDWRGDGAAAGRGRDDDTEELVPVAFTLRFSSLPVPVSVSVSPPVQFSAQEMPPASHLSPLLERLYHNKVGFGCLTSEDRQLEQRSHSSLLFGEVLFSGVTKLMDCVHLDGRRAASGGGLSVVDLGSGVGKLCLQVWLQYEWVQRVEGVELAVSRFGLGRQALLELVKGEEDTDAGQTEGRKRKQQQPLPFSPYVLLNNSASSISVASTLPSAAPARCPSTASLALSAAPSAPPRTLTFTRGDLFHCRSALSADIVIIETLILPDSYALLTRLLERLRRGCRLLTFGDIRGLWVAGADDDNVRLRTEAISKRRRDRQAAAANAAEPGAEGGDVDTAEGEAETGGEEEEEEEEEDDEEEEEEAALQPLRYSCCPFAHLEANQSKLDRFLTTWSQRKGHYFFLWEKVS